MLRYTSPPPTPHLELHVCYKESEKAGVWIGYIQEVGGIFMQSSSVEELYADAIECTSHMLNRYKRAEAFALLREKGHQIKDTGQAIAFTLADGPPPPSIL
jgi:hypothetical protein